jgi:hypothetical protein
MKALKSAGIALMLLASVALATQDGVILKYTPKKGDVLKLRIKGSLQIMGTDVVANLVTQSTVKEVAEDGSYTLEDKQLGGTASLGGQEMEIPETPGNIVVFNADGSVKEIRGDDVGPEAYRVAALNATNFPKTAVKVGSKWTEEVKANSEKGTVAMKREYEVVAEETIDGVATFVVKSKVSETQGAEPAAIEGKVWLAKSDSQLVKAEQKWINVPMAGAPGPITGSFVITREK